MFLNQLSVFLENREGRLDQVLGTLKNHQINIVSLSLADTSDYGMYDTSSIRKIMRLVVTLEYSLK